MYPISACVFIRNTYKGAFCIFESMASILPFVSEFIIMDLGSDDGTFETLLEIEKANPKVTLLSGSFSKIDANVFATQANDLISMCKYDNVLYYQADEIWHQDLLMQMDEKFKEGKFELGFWRIQFRENFQIIKWLPHIVHRVGQKDSFEFEGDGMNTGKQFGVEMCSNFNAGWFTRWGDEFQLNGLPKNSKEDTPDKIPVDEMITDVSLVGAFIDNIVDRRYLHAPFWHEEPHIENYNASQWYNRELKNPNWFKTESPFDIPHILKGCIGMRKYELRNDLLEALKADNTIGLLGL